MRASGEEFSYDRRLFFVITVLVLGFGVWPVFWAFSDVSGSDASGTIVATVLVTIVGVLLLAPVLFTRHAIGMRGIRVRMGLLFDETISWAEVARVESYPAKLPWFLGYGVRLGFGASPVFVVSAHDRLVRIMLKSKRRMPWSALFTQKDEIVLNVDEPDRFVKAAGEFGSSSRNPN